MLDRLRGLLPGKLGVSKPVVPVVRISGPIGLVTPLRPGVTLSTLAGPLERAFAVKGAPAVAIVINSPGGSPVQSHLIFRRIRTLAEEKGRKVVCFVEDVAASGGYMIACAADEIVADPSSVVGSIGVVSSGFGFVEAIHKLGIERRVHTAGGRKAILDPFRPEKPEDVEHLLALQQEVHDTFADLVRERRGALLSDDPQLFSGLFWTGKAGIGLGLVDTIGDLRGVLRDRYGPDVKLKLIAGEKAWPWKRGGGVGIFGGGAASLADDAVSALETRALWNRYGL